MPRKKTVRKKRGPSKKKKSARKTTARRRSSRSRGKPLGRGLVAVVVGAAVGWALVSWYGGIEDPAGSALPGLNVTARGDMLVEIPTREQVAAMSHEERERVEGQVLAALDEVEDRANEPAPGRSKVAKRGRFEGADQEHQGSGTVELYQTSGDRLILRLNKVKVTNGPSLHVYVVDDPQIPTRSFSDLGRLKGTVGSQNYEISTGHGLQSAQIRYVVIYDELFDRTYATATLKPAG